MAMAATTATVTVISIKPRMHSERERGPSNYLLVGANKEG